MSKRTRNLFIKNLISRTALRALLEGKLGRSLVILPRPVAVCGQEEAGVE
jgi:hypothetical protein